MNPLAVKVSRNFSGRLLKILLMLSYLAQWIFGLSPLSKKCYRIFQLYVFLWICGVCIAAYSAIVYDIVGDEETLNGLVCSIIFTAHICGHLVILVDSLKMHYYRMPLYENFLKIQKIFEEDLHIPYKRQDLALRLSSIILIYGCLTASVHGIIIWSALQSKSLVTLLYWRSLCSYLALQSKTLEFLMCMVVLNYFVEILLENAQKLGERNLHRVFRMPWLMKTQKSKIWQVWSLYQEQEDEQQVEILKSTYAELYMQFEFLNLAYGYSLLALTAVYFTDFVCNTYWILLLLINQIKDYYALLQSACFVMLAFVSLTLLCSLCEEAGKKSRIIGCLISKLVKPLGNKRYNDLVSEFSMQTLHQRFIVTAKEFFNLNLGLLGSMVAAIVTYLVILIQFMFNEEKDEMKRVTSTTVATIAANVSTILQASVGPGKIIIQTHQN